MKRLFFLIVLVFLSTNIANTLTYNSDPKIFISELVEDALKTLGAKKIEILRKIHFPMLRNSGLVALLLISIEVIKELPATLVLRPFNFDTLSISAYIYASDERMVEAAAPSIGIVLISLIPILLLIKILDKDKNE